MVTTTTQTFRASDQQNIRHAALSMIAGLAKLDRYFYDRDIEAIIDEARLYGEVLYGAGAPENVRLTDDDANAARVAFGQRDFQILDALWLEKYDELRASGVMPGTKEAWWD